MEIKKVVVIGSGTMGSGIAAHLCNAGIPVTLLDLTTEISEKARERIHKSRPPLLIDKSKINNIKVGNIDENFDSVKDADWVVEAVVERIDIKHQIYDKIFKSRKDDAIVSSNTSSIPIRSYKPNTPVLGMPIGLPKTASASSIESFILNASVIAICIA